MYNIGMKKRWPLALALVVVVLTLAGVGTVIALNSTEAQPLVSDTPKEVVVKSEPEKQAGSDPAEFPSAELTRLTNIERVKAGLQPVTENAKLDTSALAKCNDMVTRDYWAHDTPEGTHPWVFITNAGYSYSASGENLAYGFGTSADTVEGWMNSPKHRENIVNPLYTEVGFGACKSENYNESGPKVVIVQHFARPYGM